MSQSLLVPHLAQLLQSWPHPSSSHSQAAFYDVHAKQTKNAAGQQAKYIVSFGLVLKRDRHDENKG